MIKSALFFLLFASSVICLPEGTWTKIASLNEDFSLPLPGARIIRFGDGTNWVNWQDSGSGTCSNVYFGYFGAVRITECQLFTPTNTSTVPTKPKNGGPLIDVTKIPPGFDGFSDLRVTTSTLQPGPSDGVGSFRIGCRYSHMLFDDPIVFPGQPGASHLHMFFGNTGTDAFSTTDSLTNTGNSTCPGGIANRSGYWVASMIDTRDGTPLKPVSSIFYYKSGYQGIAPNWIQELPHGLRMIVGNAKGNSSMDGQGLFECQDSTGGYNRTNHIINCPVGSLLHTSIDFPQCWDGVNLDSPDHKSHMSPTVNRKCPPTHPVAIPVITINMNWVVKEKDAPLHWRLSSDMYSTNQPGGYSYHADWWNGWNPTIMSQWIQNCDRVPLDCHASLLGYNVTLF